VNNTTKALGGKASFLLGTAKASMRYRNQRVKVVLDPDTPDEKRVDTRVYLVAIANAKYFGGGMKIAPGAKMDDGAFDVVVMGDLSKTTVMMKTRSVYAGRHLTLDKVDVHHARVIRAEAADPDNELRIDMDGEMPGCLPATWRLIPSALRISTGPDSVASR